MRGGSAKSRRMHGGGVLARSSCARLARVLFVLVVSIARLRLRISFMRLADEKKKKKHSVEYFFYVDARIH